MSAEDIIRKLGSQPQVTFWKHSLAWGTAIAATAGLVFRPSAAAELSSCTLGDMSVKFVSHAVAAGETDAYRCFDLKFEDWRGSGTDIGPR